MKIIKQELEFEECLKQRLEFICEFSKVTPTFISGSIRKLEKTNLTYIEPHRVIIKNITFLVFNYSNDIYITNLTKKIKLSELEEYLPEISFETQPLYSYSSNPMILITRTYENYNKQKEKHYQNKGSISYLIYQYNKLFGISTESVLKSNITRITPELIAEIKKMNEYSNQARFLAKNNINTEQELFDFEKFAYERVNPLKSKRENLWRKHKRAKTNEEKQEIENKIVEISKQITPIAEEIKHCNNIKQRMEEIKQYQLHEQIEREKAQFEKEQEKNKKDKNKAR